MDRGNSNDELVRVSVRVGVRATARARVRVRVSVRVRVRVLLIEAVEIQDQEGRVHTYGIPSLCDIPETLTEKVDMFYRQRTPFDNMKAADKTPKAAQTFFKR